MCAKEGEGMFMDEIHIPCPSDGCNGNIIFTGFVGSVKWFKCCICGREFENRRSKISTVKKERRRGESE